MVTHSEDEERPNPVEPARSSPSTQPMSPPDGASVTDPSGKAPQLEAQRHELKRMREELAAANRQLDTRGLRQRRVTLLRQVVAAVLAFVTALGMTLSVIGAGRDAPP